MKLHGVTALYIVAAAAYGNGSFRCDCGGAPEAGETDGGHPQQLDGGSLASDVPQLNSTAFALIGAVKASEFSSRFEEGRGAFRVFLSRPHINSLSVTPTASEIGVECGTLPCHVTGVTVHAPRVSGALALDIDGSGSLESARPGEDCLGCPTDQSRMRIPAVKGFLLALDSYAPGVRLGLFQFSDTHWTDLEVSADEFTTILGDMGSDLGTLLAGAERLQGNGCTPLRDSLIEVINRVSRTSSATGGPIESRDVVVLSDGSDSCSESTQEDVIKLATERDVRIHIVGLGQRGEIRPAGIVEGYRDEFYMPTFDTEQQLAAIAEATGGIFVEATATELAPTLARLAAALVDGYIEVDGVFPDQRPHNAAATGKLIVTAEPRARLDFSIFERAPPVDYLDEEVKKLAEGGVIVDPADEWHVTEVMRTADGTETVDRVDGVAVMHQVISGRTSQMSADYNHDGVEDYLRVSGVVDGQDVFSESWDDNFDGQVDRTKRYLYGIDGKTITVETEVFVGGVSSGASTRTESSMLRELEPLPCDYHGNMDVPEKCDPNPPTGMDWPYARYTDSNIVVLTDENEANGRCKVKDAVRILRAVDKALRGSLGDCLRDRNEPLHRSMARYLQGGFLIISCDLRCLSPGNESPGATRGGKPDDPDYWKDTQPATYPDMHLDPRLSDAELDETLLHELIHWANGVPDNTSNDPFDPNAGKMSLSYACGEYCNGCKVCHGNKHLAFDSPGHACAVCSTPDKKASCGFERKIVTGETQDLRSHDCSDGLGGSGIACSEWFELWNVNCDGTQIPPGKGETAAGAAHAMLRCCNKCPQSPHTGREMINALKCKTEQNPTTGALGQDAWDSVVDKSSCSSPPACSQYGGWH